MSFYRHFWWAASPYTPFFLFYQYCNPQSLSSPKHVIDCISWREAFSVVWTNTVQLPPNERKKKIKNNFFFIENYYSRPYHDYMQYVLKQWDPIQMKQLHSVPLLLLAVLEATFKHTPIDFSGSTHSHKACDRVLHWDCCYFCLQVLYDSSLSVLACDWLFSSAGEDLLSLFVPFRNFHVHYSPCSLAQVSLSVPVQTKPLFFCSSSLYRESVITSSAKQEYIVLKWESHSGKSRQKVFVP